MSVSLMISKMAVSDVALITIALKVMKNWKNKDINSKEVLFHVLKLFCLSFVLTLSFNV